MWIMFLMLPWRGRDTLKAFPYLLSFMSGRDGPVIKMDHVRLDDMRWLVLLLWNVTGSELLSMWENNDLWLISNVFEMSYLYPWFDDVHDSHWYDRLHILSFYSGACVWTYPQQPCQWKEFWFFVSWMQTKFRQNTMLSLGGIFEW